MIKQATSIDISPPTVCRVIRRPVKRLTSGFTKVHRSNLWLKFSILMSISLFGLMRQVVMNHPVYNRLLHHGERISAICVLACKFMKGTVNGKRFLDFLQGTLISEMLPFDGEKLVLTVLQCNTWIRHAGY